MAINGPETTRRPEGFPFQKSGEVVPLLPTSTLMPAWLGRAKGAMDVAQVLASANESGAQFENKNYLEDGIKEVEWIGRPLEGDLRPTELAKYRDQDYDLAA